VIESEPQKPQSYLEELGIKPTPPAPKHAPPFLVALAGLLVGAAAAAVIVLSVSKDKAPAVPVASVSAAPAPAPKPSASAAAEVALSPLARAALGEADPLKELEARKRDERSAEETLAMARGRTAATRGDIAELRRKIGLVPRVAQEKSTVETVRRYARDRAVAVDILEMLAGLDGSAGPDLIYKVWRDQRSPDETRKLAEDLLYSRDLRAKASPALSVALELWTVEGETPACEEVSKLLVRATEQGDKRAEAPMLRLHNKRGCGKNKLLDCWPCLRTGDVLKDAGAAVRKREPPL
jgi:hypothetical protein